MIELDQLKLGYGGRAVVDLPHFSLQQGQHCLITGPSGSGKTTLLYALAGLLTPLSGSVRVAGTDLGRLRGAQRDAFRGAHIGMVYQTLHMVAAITVLQNLLLAQYASGLPQREATAGRLLAALGVADKMYEKPAALSHGQLQRVAIARAAMNAPKLIVCDEPTSALDDAACEAVLQLLHGVAAESEASLVIATHDHRIARHFTTRIEL